MWAQPSRYSSEGPLLGSGLSPVLWWRAGAGLISGVRGSSKSGANELKVEITLAGKRHLNKLGIGRRPRADKDFEESGCSEGERRGSKTEEKESCPRQWLEWLVHILLSVRRLFWTPCCGLFKGPRMC